MQYLIGRKIRLKKAYGLAVTKTKEFATLDEANKFANYLNTCIVAHEKSEVWHEGQPTESGLYLVETPTGHTIVRVDAMTIEFVGGKAETIIKYFKLKEPKE